MLKSEDWHDERCDLNGTEERVRVTGGSDFAWVWISGTSMYVLLSQVALAWMHLRSYLWDIVVAFLGGRWSIGEYYFSKSN